MQRNSVRDRQKVWWVTIEEIHEGIDNIIKYGKPEMLKQTVSATSGTPEEIAAGIVPNYDRYVTHYKSKSKPFNPVEGMGVFVDVEPELDETGNLVMEEDGYTPVTPPDYRLVEILDTKKGSVAKYGISKISN
jgi:hypothetical protein